MLRWSIGLVCLLGFMVASGAVMLLPGEHDVGQTPFAPGGSLLSFTVDPDSNEPLGLQLLHTQASVLGQEVFERDWAFAIAGQPSALGPGFDASNCASCHIEMSKPKQVEARPLDLLIAQPVSEKDRITYGAQVHRHHTEAGKNSSRLKIESSSHDFIYPDGSKVRLTRRDGVVVGENGAKSPVALRVAPLIYGWGLLEQVDTDMLMHFHDPEDQDGDGISGRMSEVLQENGPVLGTLGWKASHSTLRDQVSAALVNDMGIESAWSCALDDEPGCEPEISERELSALIQFTTKIGVPHRRPGATIEGQSLFGQAGCASCHTPVLMTDVHEREVFNKQLIWAYSDLMLHDMGPGLRDPGDSALASEWRTAPLWSAGLIEKHFPQRGFLHDGRARTIEEAILWHGGEAQASRDAFANLSKTDREALLDYVRAL